MTNFFIVRRHGWMKTHDYITQNDCEPVPTFDKRPFCLDNLSYVIVSALEVNNTV